MDRKKELPAIPKLRFPEFRRHDQWTQEPLGGICDRIAQGGTPDTSNPEYWNGSIDWLTPADMGRGESPFIDSTAKRISGLGLANCSSQLLPTHSVIVSTRAPIGHLGINTRPIAINQGCRGLVAGPGLQYFFLYASLAKAKSRLADLGAGSTFKELSGASLRGLKITVPTVAEQERIVACLMSLDKVIVAQSLRLKALNEYRRGLMEQLFPREGETVPRLRFPEFRDAPDWEQAPLSTSASLVSGLHLSPDEYEHRGEIPYFTGPSDFTNDLNTVAKWVPHSANTAQAHDTLVTVKGSGVGELWYMTIRSAAIGRQLMAVRADGCASRFIYYSLLAKRSRFEDLASGNLIPGLTRSDILDLPVMIPSNAEQQRIADCITSIDTQIDSASNQLDALKAHKAGLMQQLFPAPPAD